MPITLLLTLLALLIIAGLGWYALRLWRQVWQRQAAVRDNEDERNQRLAEDIEFLTNSLVTRQVPVIEGSIRIKVLLDNYSGALNSQHDCEIFTLIYDATAHIPTHQAWKALSPSERKLHEKHMQQLEEEHGERVTAAAGQLSRGLSNP
ncbi:DUF2489 domain-containing protein [Halopseudomonas salegens]|uniref:DUF2489 domain-containing protein n=1 Tax=Halopseudomonas salegens TaxID=1434072 RepID=A0A1H2EL62_9GAMM|nr:DUF2489 domain-containing protein [Halopseudomonas salegens]SDT95845.1 Protein of unknown function [Halopseudomonas salegens]